MPFLGYGFLSKCSQCTHDGRWYKYLAWNPPSEAALLICAVRAAAFYMSPWERCRWENGAQELSIHILGIFLDTFGYLVLYVMSLCVMSTHLVLPYHHISAQKWLWAQIGTTPSFQHGLLISSNSLHSLGIPCEHFKALETDICLLACDSWHRIYCHVAQRLLESAKYLICAEKAAEIPVSPRAGWELC